MTTISDFTDTDTWTIESTLKERWGNDCNVELQFATTEIRIYPGDKDTTECPAVLWSYNGCNFVIFKIGLQQYRCQFYYKGYQQYGTGIPEYDDIGDCIVSLLQVQADHARQNSIDEETQTEPPRGTQR